jgi:hypothetical protein
VTACAACGYRIDFAIALPSTQQASKWFKHGVDVIATPGTYTIQAGSAPPPNTSHFAPGLDLLRAIQWVACSGTPVQPLPGRHGDQPSMMFCVGTTTGGGIFGGFPRIFTGVRAVNISSPTSIHFYADDVDPRRDLSVQCPTCQRQHPAAALPPVCVCGAVLLR